MTQRLLWNLINSLGYISRSSGAISCISTNSSDEALTRFQPYFNITPVMTSLSVLFIALLCVLYINTHISGVDSRPPDHLPISAHKDDVTDEVSGNNAQVSKRLYGWIFRNIDLLYRQDIGNINRSCPCWGESSPVSRVYVDVWGEGG